MAALKIVTMQFLEKRKFRIGLKSYAIFFNCLQECREAIELSLLLGSMTPDGDTIYTTFKRDTSQILHLKNKSS